MAARFVCMAALLCGVLGSALKDATAGAEEAANDAAKDIITRKMDLQSQVSKLNSQIAELDHLLGSVDTNDTSLLPADSSDARQAAVKAPSAPLAQDRGVTVIVMNWDRPTNLYQTILPKLSEMGVVKEIIVSHGKKETMFETPDLPKVRNVEDSVNNEKLGLMRRFKLAELVSKTNCVLWMDDDILPTEKAVTELYEQWRKHPHVIHGPEPRYLVNNGQEIAYAWMRPHILPRQSDRELTDEPVPIILTQFLMGDKSLGKFVAFRATHDQELAKWVKERTIPYWNGEDIFINMASVYLNEKDGRTGPEESWPRLHRYIKGGLEELQQSEVAVSWKKGHWEYRSEAVRHFGQYFKDLGAATQTAFDVTKMSIDCPTCNTKKPGK